MPEPVLNYSQPRSEGVRQHSPRNTLAQWSLGICGVSWCLILAGFAMARLRIGVCEFVALAGGIVAASGVLIAICAFLIGPARRYAAFALAVQLLSMLFLNVAIEIVLDR